MFFQGAEGVVELAIIATLVTAEEVGMAVGVAEGEKRAQSLAGWIFAGVRIALSAGFVDEAGGFERPDAKKAPVGDCHLFDEEELDVVLRVVLGIEGIAESGEASAGFVGEKDGLEEEGFAAGVTASGSGGVGAVGGEFAVGDWHTRRIIRDGRKGKYVKLLILFRKIVEQGLDCQPLGCFFNGPVE
jgi:hypothetical protein